MLGNETAHLEEVAGAIGRKPAYLKRNWLKLHEEHGFPRKLPTGFVWPRRSVEAWLRGGGKLPLPYVAANNNDADADIVAAASRSLGERYGVRP